MWRHGSIARRPGGVLRPGDRAGRRAVPRHARRRTFAHKDLVVAKAFGTSVQVPRRSIPNHCCWISGNPAACCFSFFNGKCKLHLTSYFLLLTSYFSLFTFHFSLLSLSLPIAPDSTSPRSILIRLCFTACQSARKSS